jgi:hypothetical protein
MNELLWFVWFLFRYLAYLPAAHILEFAVETGMLVFGAAVGYSDPKTISSKGALRRLPDGEERKRHTRTMDACIHPAPRLSAPSRELVKGP